MCGAEERCRCAISCVGVFCSFAFFALVIFAAATSAISLYEACVASFCDLLHIQRKQCALILRRMVERGELAQSGQKYYLPRNEGRKAE